MNNHEYKSFTLVERPDLANYVGKLHSLGWSKFMLQDPIGNEYFDYLPKLFPELQFLLLDKEENVIACGNAVSFHWDGTITDLPSGWDGVLKRAVEEKTSGITPNTVSAIAIVVNPIYRGKNISEIMVREMKDLVRRNQFEHMLAPVRPSLKHQYPLIPMERYAYWKNKDMEPFDPWIRIHSRTNAHVLKIAEESMVITGKISDWEDWVGMSLPDTGAYIVPSALVPITIDKEKDIGEYIEPNVWMRHVL